MNEYHLYLDKGNYLDHQIALQIFQTRCSATSKLVLKTWEFDDDFIEVSSNQALRSNRPEVSYLDVARIANHLLMFRSQDERIEEHEVEFNLDGAEVLFELSNLPEEKFQEMTHQVLSSSGF